ncbi:MAG: ribbon-helix-helix protein, CopG family [Caldilineaceae bacterium]|nr:ribbon-helix-helix protein, CopG family [Caldilineaceae bacterium]
MKRKVAQIQFTQQQVEQLDDLKRQTGLTRTELVRRAVDFYILNIREHGYKSTTIPLTYRWHE